MRNRVGSLVLIGVGEHPGVVVPALLSASSSSTGLPSIFDERRRARSRSFASLRRPPTPRESRDAWRCRIVRPQSRAPAPRCHELSQRCAAAPRRPGEPRHDGGAPARRRGALPPRWFAHSLRDCGRPPRARARFHCRNACARPSAARLQRLCVEPRPVRVPVPRHRSACAGPSWLEFANRALR